MPVLSFAIAWFGYTLLAYGVATVRGCNVTFKAIAWPGDWANSGGCNPDAGTLGSAATTPGVGGNGKTLAPNTPANADPLGLSNTGSGPLRDYNPNQQSIQGTA